MDCRSVVSSWPRTSTRWPCSVAPTPSSAGLVPRRIDEPRPLRDGRRSGSARTAQDAHEGILRLLDAVRRATEREYVPGLPVPARDAARAQRRRRATGRASGACARLHREYDLDLRAQELLLSGSA